MELIRTEFGVAVERPGDEPLPLRHIIGIGRNYADHAGEMGGDAPTRPMYFTKNPMAACLHADDIVVPPLCRDPETGAGGQFNRGKGFDTFCPLGPRLVPAADVPDPQALTLTTRVSGETMQRASTAQMIFPVATLIAELSRATTLMPGTVILTGTPSGVGHARTPPRYLRDGDVVEVEIGGVGLLRNPVRFG